MAEALLLQLDRPAAGAAIGSPAGETRDRRLLDEYLRGLRGKYSSQEEQARAVAEALAAERDAEASQRLRERLKIVVIESFGLRQELQKAELELLRERIRGIETQLQLREKLRDEIIKHRVEQLANGEVPPTIPPPVSSLDKPRGAVNVMDGNFELMFNQLAWDQVLQIVADATGLALEIEEFPPGTFSYRSPKPQTIDEAFEVVRTKLPAGYELVRNDGHLVVRRRSDLPMASVAPADKITTFRSPEEFQRAAQAAQDLITGLGPPRPSSRKLAAQLQQRLSLIRDEYAARIRLLELEVQEADATLKVAGQSLARTKAFFEGGQASSTDMDQATLSHGRAKVRLEKAQTLLDLYRKAGATSDLLHPGDE